VVKQHNGWINVYSEPDQGTTFNIYIPVSDTASDDRSTGKKEGETVLAASHYKGNQERILVIEDQPGVRNVVTTALTTNGYLVTEAGTLSEARECLTQADVPFDLLFSDVVLPDGNGIEFADIVCQTHPDVKILLSSGYSGEKARPDKTPKKDFHFLQKPYQIQEMLETIKKILI